MLSTIERVLFFRSVDIFAAIAGEDLVPVARAAREVQVAAGETFVRQGEPGDSLYIVIDGEVEISVGAGQPVGLRGTGSVVGEMAVLSGRPRSATCRARTEVLLLQLFQDDFMELLEERPALALGVIQTLTERLDEATQRLSEQSRS